MVATRDSVNIAPGGIQGTLRLPPSKSHTLRAILFASLASGTSTIKDYLRSTDTEAMIAACRQLGAIIEQEENLLTITGTDLSECRDCVIDAANSGQVLRFVGAISALTSSCIQITGDESLQTRRPCEPLVEGLRQLGARAESSGGHAPITIQGPISAGKVCLDGKDSQPVSALMIAASLLPGCTEIEVHNLGERPWLNLTLDWLKRLGVRTAVQEPNKFFIYGGKRFSSFTYQVPGDLSTLAFPLVCALLTESSLMIENADLSDIQGDKVILTILKQMGALVTCKEKAILVVGPQQLHGCDIDVNDCIDALPILAVVGCFAKGKTRLFNGQIARTKESDRISAMNRELSKMGAKIVENQDGFLITHAALSGGQVESHADHRLGLALAVAAMAAKGPTTLLGGACVKKSYPNFFYELQRLGGRIS